MGLRIDQDIRGGTRLVEPAEHVGTHGVLRSRGELAVGKGARTAFAELDVRCRIKIRPLVEGTHRLLPLLDAGAAFDHDRTQSRAGKVKGGEHARRAEAHHDGPFFGDVFETRDGKLAVGFIGQGGTGFDEGPFDSGIHKVHGEHEHQVDVRALTGIDASPKHLHAADLPLRNVQHARGNGNERSFGVGSMEIDPKGIIERARAIRKPNHVPPPFPR